MSNLGFLQAGIIAWLDSLFPTATVLWDNSEHPRAASTSVTLIARIVSGPNAEGFSVTSRLLPTSAVFRITGATAGQGIYAEAAGRSWSYTPQPGDDVTAVRDGLLALMTAEPTIAADIEEDGVDGIALDVNAVGDLWNLAVRGEIAIEIEEADLAEVEAGDVHYTLEVEALSTGRYPRAAIQAVAELQRRLRADGTSAVLDPYGISVNEQLGTSIIRIPTLSGSRYEGDAAIRFGASQYSVTATPAVEIETVELVFAEPALEEEFNIP